MHTRVGTGPEPCGMSTRSTDRPVAGRRTRVPSSTSFFQGMKEGGGGVGAAPKIPRVRIHRRKVAGDEERSGFETRKVHIPIIVARSPRRDESVDACPSINLIYSSTFCFDACRGRIVTPS